MAVASVTPYPRIVFSSKQRVRDTREFSSLQYSLLGFRDFSNFFILKPYINRFFAALRNSALGFHWGRSVESRLFECFLKLGFLSGKTFHNSVEIYSVLDL
ncbi:unnamed protein product [Spirodela intermedia]|uniref:Uncharacterized protein n=1 Tax=Spirodela intermedia TaxID=51605 RepID=A0ABN7EAU0_SPIIN|nr:unnamed protein product [Spirodela intermedia]